MRISTMAAFGALTLWAAIGAAQAAPLGMGAGRAHRGSLQSDGKHRHQALLVAAGCALLQAVQIRLLPLPALLLGLPDRHHHRHTLTTGRCHTLSSRREGRFGRRENWL